MLHAEEPAMLSDDSLLLSFSALFLICGCSSEARRFAPDTAGASGESGAGASDSDTSGGKPGTGGSGGVRQAGGTGQVGETGQTGGTGLTGGMGQAGGTGQAGGGESGEKPSQDAGSAGVGSGAPKGLGKLCTTAEDCSSKHCVDGVCCESACAGVCARCDLLGEEGSCVAPPSDAACGSLRCPESTDCRTYAAGDLEQNCLELGVCVTDAPCTAVDTEAGSPCGSADATGTCDGEGECVIEGLSRLGEACDVGEECGSQLCAEGPDGHRICCDAACDGICEGCGADGHCDAVPADDARCPVDCPESEPCTDYPADPTANRCAAFGQCVTEEAYCTASFVSAGEDCAAGMVCDGAGECVYDCPDITGPERTCTADCPCGAGDGICTHDDHCVAGHLCLDAAVEKLGYPGPSCLPAHCDNDVQDSGETSVDCGGGCGCRATFEIVQLTGVPETVTDVVLEAMSGDASAFAAILNDPPNRTSYPGRVSADGAVVQLEDYGKGGVAVAINQNGSVLAGNLSCADPPDCASMTFTPYRWRDDEPPTAYPFPGEVRALSTSGEVATGWGYDVALGRDIAYRHATTSNQLLAIPGFDSVTDISGDGRVISGRLTSSGVYSLWNQQDGILSLNPPSAWTSLQIQALNVDGSVAVGYGYVSGADTYHPFVWQNGVFTDVDLVDADAKSLRPEDVSADGTVFVGQSGPTTNNRAAIWTAAGGSRTVLEELASRGLELPIDIALTDASFVSDNGRILASQFGGGSPSFWRAELLD